MNTYTPGPYHVGMKPGPMVYGPLGEQIADCRSEFLDRNENGQNARLLAAAPELLEALEFVRKFFAMKANKGEPIPIQLGSAVRAAIAKAKGE